MRPKKLELGVLNVTTHPHDDETYVGLFSKAKRQHITSKFYGSKHAMLASFFEVKNKPPGLKSMRVFAGVVNCYTDFDKTKPWLNIARGTEAEPEEVENVSLPKELKPEYEAFQFLFLADKHRIVFERIFGVSSVVRVFSGLLSAVTENEVTVTAEQDREALEAILTLHRLNSLAIRISRPNADDFGSYDQDIEERLKRQMAAEIVIELKAEKGSAGLQPDERTVETAKVALHNGNVIGKGLEEDGTAVTRATENHPLVDVSKYVGQLSPKVLMDRVRSLLNKIF